MQLEADIRLRQGRFQLDAEVRCFDSALGIFGPSGCGKSTLFRSLAGLTRPDAGRIELDGRTLFNADRRIFVPPHKRGIGLVFQDARLFPHRSVEQNLRAGEYIRKRITGRPFSFTDIVELLDIEPLLGRPVHALSGGEKQRIAIGRTLLSNPRLLLMDEPVAGLDVSLKMQILPFLARIHEQLQIPILLISHDLGEILQLTDQLLLMSNGRTTAKGSLSQLVQDPAALEALRGAALTNLLEARVLHHKPTRGITGIETSGLVPHTLEMPLNEWLPIDKTISLNIPADQIVLATGPTEGLSMRNQLPGRVSDILHAADRSLCHLDTPAGSLFAEITPATEQDLKLTRGSTVKVLFKCMATHALDQHPDSQ